jgi:hypothetical protein
MVSSGPVPYQGGGGNAAAGGEERNQADFCRTEIGWLTPRFPCPRQKSAGWPPDTDFYRNTSHCTVWIASRGRVGFGVASAIRSSRAPCGECSVRSHPSRPRENGPRPPFTTRLASKCVESRREHGPRRRNPSDAMQLMRCGMCARSFGRCVTEPGMRHCTGSAHMVVLNRLLFSSSPLFSRVEYAT